MVNGRTVTILANPGPGSDTKKPKTITYVVSDKEFAHGTFGKVFEGVLEPNKEKIAIKKVLQDALYRNRELDIMNELSHPNVVDLKYHYFQDIGSEKYLYLVMECIPESLYQVIRRLSREKRYTPMLYVRVVAFQLLRSLAYIHSLSICHRDIKPHNILIDPRTAVTKLCDFGSSKKLKQGETNIFYICSRFYRSPELILGQENYGCEIDVWAAGCVIAEMINNTVLFVGENRADQIEQIIRVLGTPTKEDLKAMNPDYEGLNLPHVPKKEWESVFHSRVSPDAVRLVANMLVYSPIKRPTAFECLTADVFQILRNPSQRLPDGEPLPTLFNWTPHELETMTSDVKAKLVESIS